jgi:hypothetical protein
MASTLAKDATAQAAPKRKQLKRELAEVTEDVVRAYTKIRKLRNKMEEGEAVDEKHSQPLKRKKITYEHLLKEVRKGQTEENKDEKFIALVKKYGAAAIASSLF